MNIQKQLACAVALANAAIAFPALAESSADSELDWTLEEVIVTAEKRDESLQSVSQAVTAITDSEIITSLPSNL